MKAKLFVFLFGVLIGFLIAILFRPLFQPMVAEILRDEADRTEGRVVGKRLQGERLLLTVDAAEGTILATFGKKVPEIDMLVEEGDLVTLGVPRYEPFVEDPPVLAVRKQELPAPETEAVAEPEPSPERPPGGIVPGRAEPPSPAPGEPGTGEDDEEDEPPAPEPERAGGEAEAEAEPPPAA